MKKSIHRGVVITLSRRITSRPGRNVDLQNRVVHQTGMFETLGFVYVLYEHLISPILILSR